MPTEHNPAQSLDRDTPFTLGIDEAGRGAMMGPMTYGVAWCPVAKKEDMEKLGFMDSKMLNEKNRSKLLEIMKDCDYMHWAVDSIPSSIISSQMLQQ